MSSTIDHQVEEGRNRIIDAAKSLLAARDQADNAADRKHLQEAVVHLRNAHGAIERAGR